MQIVGMQLAISSYAFGAHLANAVDKWIWRAVGATNSSKSENGNVETQEHRQRHVRKVCMPLFPSLFTALLWPIALHTV